MMLRAASPIASTTEGSGPCGDSLDESLNERPSDVEPDAVAAAVEHALFATDPKRRYLVVPNEPQAQRTIRKQIAQLVELNEGHVYTYDRATLIKMLDEALAKSRPRVQ